MNRKPKACPDYYPNNFDKLDKIIQNSFKNETGPGTLQSSRRNINIDTIIMPCDKIENCGPCIAWGYKEIAESKFPKTYIILGTNHHSKTKFSTYLFSSWETPIGITKTEIDLGRELLKEFPQLLNEHTAHENEHSIEIQLPWLQFASRDKLADLTFIPIAINTKELKELKELAEILEKFTKKHNIPIIASSNVEDTATIQYIKSGDSEGLINYKQRKRKEITELAPIITALEISKIREQKPDIINYQPSSNKKQKSIYHACIKFK
jgi:hypothetical protein